MPHRRLRRRPIRRVCLDVSHRHAEMPCPYCDDALGADVVEVFRRRHNQTIAEDVAGFGWS